MINIVLKEDDIIKWKRIESILQSMDFNYKQVKVEKNQKDPFIRNPPILKGIESKLKQTKIEIMNVDGPFKKNKIMTKVIKTDNDNNYFKMNMETKRNIRSPPNFY